MNRVWTPDKNVLIVPRGFRRDNYERSRIARAPFHMPPRLRKRTPLHAALAFDGSVQQGTAIFALTAACTISTAGAGELLVATCSFNEGSAGAVVGVASTTLGNWPAAVVTETSTDQYSGIFINWASAQLTNEIITFTIATSNQIAIQVVAIKGAQNMTLLTAGTDYAIGKAKAKSTVPSSSFSTPTHAVANNSWQLGAFNHWSGGASWTPDANTADVDHYGVNGAGLLGMIVRGTVASPTLLSAGTNYTIGGTAATNDNWDEVTIEILAAASGFSPVNRRTIGPRVGSRSYY